MSDPAFRPAPTGRIFRQVVRHALGGLLPALSIAAAAGCQRDAYASPHNAPGADARAYVPMPSLPVRQPVPLPSLPPPTVHPDAGAHHHTRVHPKLPAPAVGLFAPRRIERRATAATSAVFAPAPVGGRGSERG